LLHSVNEACVLLGICDMTVYRLIATNRLESVKIGRRRLITADSIRRLASSEVA
jgi:excisionase family DNA binding protein